MCVCVHMKLDQCTQRMKLSVNQLLIPLLQNEEARPVNFVGIRQISLLQCNAHQITSSSVYISIQNWG